MGNRPSINIQSALITFERYFAICHPVLHRNFFPKDRAKSLLVFVCLLGTLLMLYAPFFANKDYGCYVVWDNKTAQIIFGVFTFAHTYIIPLCLIVFCYVNIWRQLHRRALARKHNVGNQNQNNGEREFGRIKKNVTITLLIIAIAFVVCWTPASVTYALYNFGYPYDITSDMHASFLMLVTCNNGVNPIVYAFKYHEFRRQCKFIFCPSSRVGDEPSQITESTS